MIRTLLFLFLLAPLFLATSCIEGEEEIWIDWDASGRLTSRYEFPSLALSQIGDPHKIIDALHKIAAREEGLNLTKCTSETKNGKVIFRLEAEFDNILELLEVAKRNEELFVQETGTDPDKISSVAGLIDFRVSGLRPTFDRVIDPSEIFPEVVAQRPGMLGPSKFSYIIHLPAKVRQTNAHEISDDGKTVKWSFVLKDHFETPMTMSLDTQIPIPWWAWMVVGLLVVSFLWLLWWVLVRRRLNTRDRRPADQVDLPTA